MVTRGLQQIHNNLPISCHPERRQSILLSSNPKTVARPIDCILVYNLMNDDGDQSVSHYKKHSERRQRFESFLKEKHNLILETEVGLNDDNDEDFIEDF